jgi:multicomponent K+:H+ antiporter subunit E
MDAARRHGKAMMRRLLPAPLMSCALLVAWLLLNGTLALGHILLGAVLALVIPWWTERLRPERPRLRSAIGVARLALVVLVDIVASAAVVARQILGPEARVKSTFVQVPLTIRDPYGIATFASIITMTPGTLSADLSDDRRFLLVHALHSDDPAALIEEVKRRYEEPLRAIFGETDSLPGPEREARGAAGGGGGVS